MRKAGAQMPPAMNRLSISKRITVLAASLVLLTVVLSLLALTSVSRINARVQAITSDALPGVESIGRLEEISQEIRGDMLLHVLEPEKQSEMDRSIAELQGKFNDALRAYEKTIFRDEDRALFAKIGPAWEH